MAVSCTHLDVYKRQARDSAQPRLLEAILYKDNFNRAYKRVKANKGAPEIDGMTIEAVSYTHLQKTKKYMY